MRSITSRELRKLYLDFWKSKNHEVIKCAPLIPEGDSSVLFTIAGMQQLTPYLRGEEHPKGRMLTDIQRCVRTNDIEEVGDPGHLTCFEMLGAWSLGEYWKKEAIDMTFEFITAPQYLGIPIDKLYVSVFEGDSEIPRDTEAANAWIKAGVNPSHISFLSREHNFWAEMVADPVEQTRKCSMILDASLVEKIVVRENVIVINTLSLEITC